MRTADDLGNRARNWFWYWRVRQLSSLSNDQLDRKAFGDVGRKRHFERIQHTASSPDEIPLLEGKTLLEAVDLWSIPGRDEPKPFASATAAFRSPLWGFLTRQNIKPAEYTNFIQRTLADRGWHRIHARDLSLYYNLLGEAEPAVGPADSTAYSAMLHKLANEATPDSLALLIALFREAVHAVCLQEAMLIKSAISAAVSWMGHLMQMPESLTQLLDRLVDDRVLSNVWLTEAEWREQTGSKKGLAKSSRERLREFRAWVTWYVEECPRHYGSGYCAFPIVPASPRISWIETNRASLVEAYRATIQRGSDPEFVCFADAGGQGQPFDRAQHLLNLARAMGCPIEASPRFYSERPPLELGRLPRAY